MLYPWSIGLPPIQKWCLFPRLECAAYDTFFDPKCGVTEAVGKHCGVTEDLCGKSRLFQTSHKRTSGQEQPGIAPDSVHNCHGDRAALAYAFVTFVPNPMEQSKMAAVSRLTDFSFDRYLLFPPVSTQLGRRCATQVLTASSRKS